MNACTFLMFPRSRPLDYNLQPSTRESPRKVINLERRREKSYRSRLHDADYAIRVIRDAT